MECFNIPVTSQTSYFKLEIMILLKTCCGTNKRVCIIEQSNINYFSEKEETKNEYRDPSQVHHNVVLTFIRRRSNVLSTSKQRCVRTELHPPTSSNMKKHHP